MEVAIIGLRHLEGRLTEAIEACIAEAKIASAEKANSVGLNGNCDLVISSAGSLEESVARFWANQEGEHRPKPAIFCIGEGHHPEFFDNRVTYCSVGTVCERIQQTVLHRN